MLLTRTCKPGQAHDPASNSILTCLTQMTWVLGNDASMRHKTVQLCGLLIWTMTGMVGEQFLIDTAAINVWISSSFSCSSDVQDRRDRTKAAPAARSLQRCRSESSYGDPAKNVKCLPERRPEMTKACNVQATE